MRWGKTSIMIGTLAVATASALWAQARGGHATQTAGTAFVRGSGVGGRPLSVPRNYVAPLGLQPHAAGYTGINAGALRTRGGYRSRSIGYLAPYYYPGLDYGSAPYENGAFDPPPDDPSLAAGFQAQSQLSEQVQRLSEAVEQLQNGQQQSQGQEAGAQAANQPPQTPVTLVLRSGQQLQIQNFAVMDKTVWDFTRSGVRKIPISSIDVAASAKATEATGGEFPSLD